MTDFGASLRIDHELLAIEEEHRVNCMLELTAPPAPAGKKRQPLHLVLAIDRSGSMHGEKLHTAKECARFLASKLRDDDQLSIVAYETEVSLVHPLSPVGNDRGDLHRAIASIEVAGQTNLSGGWLKGFEQLHAVAGGNGPRKVLLLSDGLANVGISDATALADMARGATDEGIGTTTIGFGDGFDEELMTAMADAGSGNAYFAAGVDEAPGIFAQEFDDLVSVVAQNLSIEVRPTNEVAVIEVLNDYPHLAVPGGIQLQLGDAYGGERRRLVFSLNVPSLQLLGPVTVCDLVVRYTSVSQTVALHEVHVPVLVNLVSADEAATAAADATVVEEIVILMSARAQAEARGLALDGNQESASKLLRDGAQELRRVALGSARAEELTAQADEMESFDKQVQMGGFDAMLSKQMYYSMREKHRKRGPGPADGQA